MYKAKTVARPLHYLLQPKGREGSATIKYTWYFTTRITCNCLRLGLVWHWQLLNVKPRIQDLSPDIVEAAMSSSKHALARKRWFHKPNQAIAVSEWQHRIVALIYKLD